MFYKEDCIVHEPKDPNDAIIPPNKPLVYPFEIRLDRGLPATIAYEEGTLNRCGGLSWSSSALATVCYEVLGFVVVAVPKNKKPLFIVSAPKDRARNSFIGSALVIQLTSRAVFLWGTTQARWERVR